MKTTTRFPKITSVTGLLIGTLSSFISFSQPSMEWQKSFGGSMMDMAYSTISTTDGGFIMIGESKSNNGDVSGHHTASSSAFDQDVWVVKTDAHGILEWENSYGGTSFDVGAAIIQTSDGGYAFTGTTLSNDGDVSGYHGTVGVGGDAWLVKIAPNGAIEWQKCFGGSNADYGKSIAITSDGGFILGTVSNSNDGDVSGNHGLADIWTVKLDASAGIVWQKSFGGTGTEGQPGMANNGNNYPKLTILESTDGGFFICTNSMSVDGDVTGHHGPGGIIIVNGVSHYDADIWTVKLDGAGNLQWQKSLGGTDEDWGYSAVEAADGGYMIIGSTKSGDGDVTGNMGAGTHGWAIKLDALGVIQWQELKGVFGSQSWYYSIVNTLDGGYFITGKKGNDLIATKMEAGGITQWQKTIGGTAMEAGTSGFQAEDGGYVIGGWSASTNGDINGNHGGNDYLLLKLYAVPNHVISGTVYEDLNANCIKDSNEVGLAGRIVKAIPGNYFATTDINGDYALFVEQGNYTVSHIAQTFYNQSCPIDNGVYNVSISVGTPNVLGNNFADTLTTHCSDLKVNISTPMHRRCFKNTYAITYTNIGSLAALNTSVTVTFPPEVIPLSSSIPWSIVGGQYVFSLDTIQPFQGGIITILDSVSCLSSLGTLIGTSAIISTDETECNLVNNTNNFYLAITGSCDPNSMAVASQIEQTGYVLEETISASDTLTYMIKFQNIGNDTAFTVVVRDTLSEYLNYETIEIMNTSHAYTFQMYGQGICEWTFNNIHLTDTISNEVESHGFITFTIQQNSGNTPGTVIENSAAIWFDYNSSISTNGTLNTVLDLSAGIGTFSNNELSSVSVYPNPFHSNATFQVATALKNGDLTVYNLSGAEVKQMKNLNGNEFNLDREGLENGFYMYRITENGQVFGSGKIVIN